MSTKQTQTTPSSHTYNEDILVVSRTVLFQSTSAWQGIRHDIFDVFVHNIEQNACYIPRAQAETNPSYKQIIPYLVFKHKNTFFVMQRKATASEQRLANKFSLGIGGHIRQDDISNNNIFDWAKREFEEEVTYNGNIKISNLGVLNDDSSDVGKVHLGMVLLLEGDSDQISIKDEHKSGTLLTLEECKALNPRMEAWSKIILEIL